MDVGIHTHTAPTYIITDRVQLVIT